MAKQLLNYGTQAEFNSALQSNKIEATGLYFITDTQRIYKGADVVAMTSVMYPATMPDASTMTAGTLYVYDEKIYTLIDDQVVCLNKNLAAGAISSLTMFDASVIDTATDEELSAAKLSTSARVSADIEAAKQHSAHDVEFDTSAYKLTIPMYGLDDLVISIPRCIKSGRYEADYELPDGQRGKAIVLVIDAPDEPTGEKEIVIPAAGLVQTFAGVAGNDIKVTVSDDNKIKAELNIAPTESKIKVTEDGVVLDLSDYLQRADVADVDKVAVITADGNIAGSRKIVSTYASGNKEDEALIPTLGVVAAAIAEAVQSANKYILPEGTENEIVTSTIRGIQRSGLTVGGGTLDTASETNLHIARESAVIDALSWHEIASE